MDENHSNYKPSRQEPARLKMSVSFLPSLFENKKRLWFGLGGRNVRQIK